MEERRKWKRLEINLPVKYEVLLTKEAGESITKDIGAGGVCVFSSKPLKEGTRLRAEIKLPNQEKPIRFTGEVLWSEPRDVNGGSGESRIGVKFVDISDEDREAIFNITGSKEAAT